MNEGHKYEAPSEERRGTLGMMVGMLKSQSHLGEIFLTLQIENIKIILKINFSKN